MERKPLCTICESPYHYATFCHLKKRKAISQRGRRAEIYEAWKKTVAIPYLDKRYGRVCAACGGVRCGNRQLDIDHIKNRSTHPELKMRVTNIQYLGRYPCHVEKTDGKT